MRMRARQLEATLSYEALRHTAEIARRMYARADEHELVRTDSAVVYAVSEKKWVKGWGDYV